jgi:hypothetical protein
MTKATILAITTLVWTAGFAATGALVYTVSKPLPKPTQTVASMQRPHVPDAIVPERTIMLPVVEIVGSLPSPVIAVKAKEHVMHCSDWRPLEQGSASVQICD